MTEIINFRLARKTAKRQKKEKLAEENRIKFGTPKQQRKLNQAKRKLADKKLDGKNLEGNKIVKPSFGVE